MLSARQCRLTEDCIVCAIAMSDVKKTGADPDRCNRCKCISHFHMIDNLEVWQQNFYQTQDCPLLSGGTAPT